MQQRPRQRQALLHALAEAAHAPAPGGAFELEELERQTVDVWYDDGSIIDVSGSITNNTTWAKELGFNVPPQSAEQFRTQACAAAQTFKRDNNPKNDQMGGWIISTHYPVALGWMYAFGAEILAADGDGYRLNTPQVEEAFDFLRSLLDSGCAWLSENQSTEAEFATRQGLFAAGSVADIPYQEEAFVAAGSQELTITSMVIPYATAFQKRMLAGSSFTFCQYPEKTKKVATNATTSRIRMLVQLPKHQGPCVLTTTTATL